MVFLEIGMHSLAFVSPGRGPPVVAVPPVKANVLF